MDRRIYGVETEFGIAYSSPQGRPLAPEEVARYLFRKVVSWGRSSNVFLANGSRLYLDVGSHPEYATAECDDVAQLIAHDRAGERILVDLIAEALRRCVQVSTDPSSVSYLREMGPERFLALTAGAETIFPNAPEASLLTGVAEAHEAARRLTAYYPTAVVKLGVNGALLARRGSPPLHAHASATPVVDTTGAGDAFFAGYLAAMCSGVGPDEALHAGIESAAEAIGRMGGRP